METQLKKLNRISKIECLNPENYYSIMIYKGEVKLQGDFDRKLVLPLTELFGKGKINEKNGYVDFRRNGIEVTLT